MRVYTSGRMPIKCWCRNPEEGALEQARHLADLPFLAGPVALMPDVHQGYGMPIGGVIATKGVVIPSAVGVDIGCGVLAVRTQLTEIDTETLKKIMSSIRENVPLGFNHRKEGIEIPALGDKQEQMVIVSQQFESAKKQVGTLGGGNHFIEIQKGSDGFIWYMIHSGSRNLGKKVCDYYTGVAKELNQLWYSSVPKEWDLAFLPIDTHQAYSYMLEMQYCLGFSNHNREVMATFIDLAFTNAGMPIDKKSSMKVNIQHNYAKWENVKGQNVLIHRKGATSAREGEVGVIPGSQGTSSYIVRGKGNIDSWFSSSHGAGRRMGRKVASNTLSLEDEIKRLDDKGILHSIRTKGDLDEAPGAYKDIDEVMVEQSDLVDIIVKLEPLAVIKG